MNIWVDADACPVVIRDILCKAAERTRSQLTMVANRSVHIPASPYISFMQVPPGLDGADNEIIARLATGDLVITSDIPLAARVIETGGIALNPRGEIYTAENVVERVSTRNFLQTLRSEGIETGGPARFSKRDRQSFANSLDRLLSRVP